MLQSWLRISALLMASAVIFGAFGAHALKSKLSEYHLQVFQTGIEYHFIHALGMLIVVALGAANLLPVTALTWIQRIFFAGIILFSGSLYLLALTDKRWLGAITPIGGTLFILGWILIAIKCTGGHE